MRNEFEQISTALTQLDKIQLKHIESFDTELLPDLELQMIERNIEFSKLKESVDQYVTKAGFDTDADTKAIVTFIERINTLLNQNQVLEKKVRLHRDALQESMKKMSRGKQVISSYGSPSSVSNRPRAINLTN